uniref:Uncharacterized protein n=1 Tax=Arundo donax TaxID=35708 RepID=A0A0A8ZSL8_ARUDO
MLGLPHLAPSLGRSFCSSSRRSITQTPSGIG